MKLKRKRLAGLVFALAGFAGLSILPLPAAAQDQPAAAPKYTRPEYDAYQAAAAEKSPQQKIKLLDDFGLQHEMQIGQMFDLFRTMKKQR